MRTKRLWIISCFFAAWWICINSIKLFKMKFNSSAKVANECFSIAAINRRIGKISASHLTILYETVWVLRICWSRQFVTHVSIAISGRISCNSNMFILLKRTTNKFPYWSSSKKAIQILDFAFRATIPRSTYFMIFMADSTKSLCRVLHKLKIFEKFMRPWK